MLQANESTNLANTEAYFLCPVTATLTQLAVSEFPSECVWRTDVSLVVITTPTIEAKHATHLLLAFTRE
jgi:hypothetical protein